MIELKKHELKQVDGGIVQGGCVMFPPSSQQVGF